MSTAVAKLDYNLLYFYLNFTMLGINISMLIWKYIF